MDNDLISLYSAKLLALAADIPHLGRLDAPQGRHRARSPQCGSAVTVDVSLEKGQIARFAQDVKACALGQASAALVGREILGKTREDVQKARDELAVMLCGGATPSAPFQELEVLRAAAPFKNRHASILLCLDATLGAFEDATASAK
ncbi:MAG: iron-sulfur cluster assembly scaffold protein [Pseudomonadota bacterium]